MNGSGKSRYIVAKLLEEDELRKLVSYLKTHARGRERGEIYDGNTSAKRDRSSAIYWFSLLRKKNNDAPALPTWFSTRLKDVAKQGVELFGETLCPIKRDKTGRWRPRYEQVQYSVYPEGGHYSAWHTDASGDKRDEEDTRCLFFWNRVNAEENCR